MRLTIDQTPPNKTDAPDAAMALWFHVYRQWCGIGDQWRSARRNEMKHSLILAMLAVGCAAFADDSQAPELGQVVAALQPITAALSPAAEVKATGPSSVTISYRTQTFKIHGGSMSGEFAKEAHDEVGPTSKGFVFSVDVQKKGEVNQAATPQTLRRPYWETYIQVTPVSGSDRQLYWGLSYGSRTDTNLLAQIRQAIEHMKEDPNTASHGTALPRHP